MTKNRLKLSARWFVFSWFFIGGLAHFANPEPFLRIMPPYIPFHLACVYVSGFFELLGAFGLWVKPVRVWAGYGFWPAQRPRLAIEARITPLVDTAGQVRAKR